MSLRTPPDKQRTLAPDARAVLASEALKTALSEVEFALQMEFLNSTAEKTQDAALAYKQANGLFNRLRRTLEVFAKADA